MLNLIYIYPDFTDTQIYHNLVKRNRVVDMSYARFGTLYGIVTGEPHFVKGQS
jgi:hypothetical protein